MGKATCSYAKRGCQFAAPSCSGDSIDCSEKDRRDKLGEIPCPAMLESGCKDCACDMTDFRALVPTGKKCSCEGKCVVREIEEVKKLFIKEKIPNPADCARSIAVSLRHAT
jgi:hypothetical protein